MRNMQQIHPVLWTDIPEGIRGNRLRLLYQEAVQGEGRGPVQGIPGGRERRGTNWRHKKVSNMYNLYHIESIRKGWGDACKDNQKWGRHDIHP